MQHAAAPPKMTSEPYARSEKEIIDASRPFAQESPARSWAYLLSTSGLLALTTTGALLVNATTWRLFFAIASGLTIVRMFVIYHDFMHGALLRKSRVARAILYTYALLAMTPPRTWRQTHNYHHAHTAKIVGSHVGSYAMVTPNMWAKMSPHQRRLYKATRHPLTILFAYFTIFMFGMCVAPFLRAWRKNWDSALSLVLNLSLTAVIIHYAGFAAFAFAYGLPLAIATALGGYLFYAQHNFPGVQVQPRESWSYTRAALESSSYLKMGPVLRWFTGNIGYHHVHHLNAQIPFYRLPEAMAAIPELQRPSTTSFAPRDIVGCLRLKLWDPASGTMVGYPADDLIR